MSPTRSTADVEAYLHAHIPISAEMDVRVRQCTMDEVVLSASLHPNLNHRSTVFGGSASAVAILAAWTWFHWALLDEKLQCRVVIQRNQMEYKLPIDGDFTAHCCGLGAVRWSKLRHTLQRYGKARAALSAVLKLQGNEVAQFTGDYVAVDLARA